MHDFGLSWKELAFEACEHQLTLGPRRTVINRRVGPVQAVQQFVAELLDEVLQAKRQFRLCGICQLVGVDGFCDRRRFKLSSNGGTTKKWGTQSLQGAEIGR